MPRKQSVLRLTAMKQDILREIDEILSWLEAYDPSQPGISQSWLNLYQGDG